MATVQQIIKITDTPIYHEFRTWSKVIDANHISGRRTTPSQLKRYNAAKEDWHKLIGVVCSLKVAVDIQTGN